MAVSRAQIAAAKVLVTPSTPFPLTNLISLMPTQYRFTISIRLPDPSTNLFLRYCSLQASLIRLGIVTSELFLKTMHLNVKVEQYWLIVLRALIQLESASSVIPGPLIKGGKNLAESTERSFTYSATPQVVLQIVLVLSPQSRSQGLTADPAKRLKKAVKFVKYVDLEKFLLSMSQPISTELQLLTLDTNLAKAEVQLVLRMRSLVQLTVPLQIAVEQLYLYPRGTWKVWQKILPIHPLQAASFIRERRRVLLAQGRNSGRSQAIPILLVQLQQSWVGGVRQSTVERKEVVDSPPERRQKSMITGNLKIIVDFIQMQVGIDNSD